MTTNPQPPTPAPAAKPVPEPDEASRPFFEGALRGELLLPRCVDCDYFLHLGSRICTQCLGENIAWTPVSGRGTLFTFGIMHQKYHPGFYAEIPYNVAVVELAEGPRLQTNIVGVRNEDLRVGMPVVVTFERVSEEVALPKFRPSEG
jgi:uncharacterized OB-fold protein